MITSILIALLVGSTLILSTAAMVTKVLPGTSAASRFSIWQISVTSQLLLPVGVFLLPEIPLGLISKTLATTPHSSRPTSDWSKQPSTSPSVFRAAELVSPPLNPNPPAQVDTEIATGATTALTIATSNLARSTPKNLRLTVSQTAMVIWLAVALALLLRILLAHCRVALAAHSTGLKINSNIEAYANWLPSSVDLAYSDRHAVPITIGIWRRRIILPAAAIKWPADQVRMVLKHELAHVVRRDVLWQLITSLVTSLFWFQPLSWWADRKLKLERERACDDKVIAGGEHAADYAVVLVQLAATFSGRTTTPAGALSMAQKPIEHRLATILSPSTPRTSTNHWLSRVATVIALLVVAGVCSIRPFAPLAAATPVPVPIPLGLQDSQPADEFPSQLTGLVVDENDEPVVGAELQLNATPRPKSKAYRSGYTQATIPLPVFKTDESGKFTVRIDELANDLDIWSIHGKVIAENRPPAPFHRTVRKGVEPVLKVRTIHFQPGKTISGRVVPPTSSADQPLTNPTIIVKPIGQMPSHQWLGATVKCQPNGRFSVMVASDVRVSIQATADNFAGVGLEVMPHVRDVNDIPLRVGTTLKGKVLDRAGLPVAGVLVCSRTKFDDHHWNPSDVNFEYRPYFFRHCKTNAKGEFQLKPQMGKVGVSLQQSTYTLHSNKSEYSDRVPPVVVPIQIDLAKPGLTSGSTQTINLKEAKTVRADGSIYWPDGSPAIGIEARVGMVGSPGGNNVFSTKSDSSGRYTVQIPEKTRSSILVTEAKNSANEWHYAKPSTTSEKVTQQSTQFLVLAPLNDNVSGLDWNLSKRADFIVERKPAEQELESLIDARKADKVKNRIRVAGAADEREREELEERNKQNSKLHSANLIAFEAKHRGEFIGAVALASYIDPEQPKQLESFAANYLDSPNADVVLSDVYQMGNLAHTRKILKTFAEKSPHASIQATAMFHEAAFIAEVLIYNEYVKKSKWHPPYPEPETQEEKEQVAKFKQLLSEIMSCDREQLLSDYVSILSTLSTTYTEHGNTVVSFSGSSRKERRTEVVNETYASQLQKLRFQLENLNSGKPLPHLTGHDVQGVDFDSARLKGKAVLMFFTSNSYTDRPNFKELRELKKRYAGRPFEIVSVMVDQKSEDAKAAVDTGKITWSTLYDEDQQLMKKWQFNPCSDRLLVDHQGVIYRRADYNAKLDETIERLVKNAEGK